MPNEEKITPTTRTFPKELREVLKERGMDERRFAQSLRRHAQEATGGYVSQLGADTRSIRFPFTRKIDRSPWSTLGRQIFNAGVINTLEGAGAAIPVLGRAALGKYAPDFFTSWENAVTSWAEGERYPIRPEAQRSFFDDPSWYTFASALGQGLGTVAAIAIPASGVAKGLSLAGKAVGSMRGINAVSATGFASSFFNFLPVIHKSAKEAGLNPTDAARFASILTPLIAMSEFVGLSLIGETIAKPVTNKITRESAKKIFTDVVKRGVTGETVNGAKKQMLNLFNRNFYDVMKMAGLKSIKSSAIEGTEEMLQGVIEKGAQQIYDEFISKEGAKPGEGKFGTELASRESLKEMLEEGFFGGIIGGMLGFSGSMIRAPMIEEGIEHYIGNAVKRGSESRIQELYEHLGGLHEAGQMDKEDYDYGVNLLDNVTKKHKSIWAGITNQQARTQSFHLISAKTDLQASRDAFSTKGNDSAYSGKMAEANSLFDKTVADIDSALNDIADNDAVVDFTSIYPGVIENLVQINSIVGKDPNLAVNLINLNKAQNMWKFSDPKDRAPKKVEEIEEEVLEADTDFVIETLGIKPAELKGVSPEKISSAARGLRKEGIRPEEIEAIKTELLAEPVPPVKEVVPEKPPVEEIVPPVVEEVEVTPEQVEESMGLVAEAKLPEEQVSYYEEHAERYAPEHIREMLRIQEERGISPEEAHEAIVAKPEPEKKVTVKEVVEKEEVVRQELGTIEEEFGKERADKVRRVLGISPELTVAEAHEQVIEEERLAEEREVREEPEPRPEEPLEEQIRRIRAEFEAARLAGEAERAEALSIRLESLRSRLEAERRVEPRPEFAEPAPEITEAEIEERKEAREEREEMRRRMKELTKDEEINKSLQGLNLKKDGEDNGSQRIAYTSRIASDLPLFNRIVDHIKSIFPQVRVEVVEELSDNYGVEVLGKAVKNTIYINENIARQDTALHELSHIYVGLMRGTDVYREGIEAIRGTDIHNEVIRKYPEYSKEKQLEEALVSLTGLRSLDTLSAKFEGNILDRIIDYLKRFWARIKKVVGKANAEDIASIISESMVARNEPVFIPENGIEGEVRYQRDDYKNKSKIHGWIYGLLMEIMVESPRAHKDRTGATKDTGPGIRKIIDVKERILAALSLVYGTEQGSRVYDENESFIASMATKVLLKKKILEEDAGAMNDDDLIEQYEGTVITEFIDSGKKLSDFTRAILDNLYHIDGEAIPYQQAYRLAAVLGTQRGDFMDKLGSVARGVGPSKRVAQALYSALSGVNEESLRSITANYDSLTIREAYSVDFTTREDTNSVFQRILNRSIDVESQQQEMNDSMSIAKGEQTKTPDRARERRDLIRKIAVAKNVISKDGGQNLLRLMSDATGITMTKDLMKDAGLIKIKKEVIEGQEVQVENYDDLRKFVSYYLEAEPTENWGSISGYMERIAKASLPAMAIEPSYFSVNNTMSQSVGLGGWADEFIKNLSVNYKSLVKNPRYKNNRILRHFNNIDFKVKLNTINGVKNYNVDSGKEYHQMSPKDFQVMQYTLYVQRMGAALYHHTLPMMGNRKYLLSVEIPYREGYEGINSIESGVKRAKDWLKKNAGKYGSTASNLIGLNEKVKELNDFKKYLEDNGLIEGKVSKVGVDKVLGQMYYTQVTNEWEVRELFMGATEAYVGEDLSDVASLFKRAKFLGSPGIKIDFDKDVEVVVLNDIMKGEFNGTDSFSMLSPYMENTIRERGGTLFGFGGNHKPYIGQVEHDGMPFFFKTSSVGMVGDVGVYGELYKKVRQLIEDMGGNDRPIMVITESALKTKNWKLRDDIKINNVQAEDGSLNIPAKEQIDSFTFKPQNFRIQYNINKVLKGITLPTQLMTIALNQATKEQVSTIEGGYADYGRIQLDRLKELFSTIDGVTQKPMDMLTSLNDTFPADIVSEIIALAEEQKVSLDHPNIISIIQNFISKQVTRDAVRIKVPGSQLHLVPDGNLAEENALRYPEEVEGVIEINEAEIRVPEWVASEGDSVISIKVPASGAMSMFVGRVVGHTPNETNTMQVPTEWISKSGSDFDADSMFVMTRPVEQDFTEQEIKDGALESQLAMYDTLSEVMKKPETIRLMREALDIADLENYIEENNNDVGEPLDRSRGMKFMDMFDLSRVHNVLTGGINLIGHLAIANKMISRFSQFGVKIYNPRLKEKVTVSDKNLVTSGRFLQVGVDNEKLLKLDSLGVNNYTISVYAAMVIAGEGERDIIQFLNKGVIKKYSEIQLDEESVLKPKEFKKKKDLEDEIISKTREGLSEEELQDLDLFLEWKKVAEDVSSFIPIMQIDNGLPNDGVQLKMLSESFSKIKKLDNIDIGGLATDSRKHIFFEDVAKFTRGVFSTYFISEHSEFYRDIVTPVLDNLGKNETLWEIRGIKDEFHKLITSRFLNYQHPDPNGFINKFAGEVVPALKASPIYSKNKFIASLKFTRKGILSVASHISSLKESARNAIREDFKALPKDIQKAFIDHMILRHGLKSMFHSYAEIIPIDTHAEYMKVVSDAIDNPRKFFDENASNIVAQITKALSPEQRRKRFRMPHYKYEFGGKNEALPTFNYLVRDKRDTGHYVLYEGKFRDVGEQYYMLNNEQLLEIHDKTPIKGSSEMFVYKRVSRGKPYAVLADAVTGVSIEIKRMHPSDTLPGIVDGFIGDITNEGNLKNKDSRYKNLNNLIEEARATNKITSRYRDGGKDVGDEFQEKFLGNQPIGANEDDSFIPEEALNNIEKNPEELDSLINHFKELYPEIEIRSYSEVIGGLELAGKPVSGKAYIQGLRRIIEWSINDGRLDTVPHEFAHHYIDMFRNVPLMQKAIKKYGEERLAQLMGEEAAKLYLTDKGYLPAKTGFGKWWQDFWNWVRSIFGTSNVARIIARDFYAGKKLGPEERIKKDKFLGNQFFPADHEDRLIDVAPIPDSIARDGIRGTIEAMDKEDIVTFHSEANSYFGKIMNDFMEANRSLHEENMGSLQVSEERFKELSSKAGVAANIDNITKLALSPEAVDDPIAKRALDDLVKMRQRGMYHELRESVYSVDEAQGVPIEEQDRKFIEEIEAVSEKREGVFKNKPILRTIWKYVEAVLNVTVNQHVNLKVLTGSSDSSLYRMTFKAFEEANRNKVMFLRGHKGKGVRGAKDIIGQYVNENTNRWFRPLNRKFGYGQGEFVDVSELEGQTITMADGKKEFMTNGEILVSHLILRQLEDVGELDRVYESGFILQHGGKKRGVAYKKIAINKAVKEDIARIIAGNEIMSSMVGATDELMDYSFDRLNPIARNLFGEDLMKVEKYFPFIVGRPTEAEKRKKRIFYDIGFLNPRTAERGPIVVGDYLEVISSHMNQASNFYANAIPVDNVKKFLSRNKASLPKYQYRAMKQFVEDLEDFSMIQSLGDKEFHKSIDSFFRNFQLAVLGLNAPVTAKQLVSLALAGSMVDSKHVKKGTRTAAKVIAQGIKGWKIPVDEVEALREIDTWSPGLGQRLLGFVNREAGEVAAETFDFWSNQEAQTQWKAFGKTRVFKKDWFMRSIKVFDAAATAGIWEAAKSEISENANVEVGSEEYWDMVSKRAEEIVARTQPTYDLIHRSQVGKTRNIALKSMTMFSSQRSKLYMMMVDAINDYILNPSSANLSLLKRTVVSVVVINSLGIAAIDVAKGMLYGNYDDDDDSAVRALAMQGIKNNFANIYFASAPFEVFWSRFDNEPWSNSMNLPMFEFVNDGASSLKSIYEGNFWKGTKRLIMTGEKIVGLPVWPTTMTSKFVEKLAE